MCIFKYMCTCLCMPRWRPVDVRCPSLYLCTLFLKTVSLSESELKLWRSACLCLATVGLQANT